MPEPRRGAWSGSERLRLRELFPTTPIDRLARMLGRTEDSVRRQATRVFRRRRRRGAWSAAEDECLCAAVGLLPVDDIALVLARSPADVARRIDRLGSRRRFDPWSAEEVRTLKRTYGSRTARDLEVCLRRAGDDIEGKARELCLGKDKAGPGRGTRMPRWSLRDIAILRRLYPTHENVEVARALGRSVASVASKASQLGLRKDPSLLATIGRRSVTARHRAVRQRRGD